MTTAFVRPLPRIAVRRDFLILGCSIVLAVGLVVASLIAIAHAARGALA